MQLSILSIVLGLAVAVPALVGIVKPSVYANAVRKFPRNTGLGYMLVILATAWFVWNVRSESIADFEPMKPYLIGLFVAVGIGTILYVKDFIAVRGAAVLMLLLAKLIVDTARWVNSDWRLVLVTWAYLMVLFGIYLTISPWRLRDMINWSVATESRTRTLNVFRCAFGLLLVVLGAAVFR